MDFMWGLFVGVVGTVLVIVPVWNHALDQARKEKCR